MSRLEGFPPVVIGRKLISNNCAFSGYLELVTRIFAASSPAEWDATRDLFREYQRCLGVDLCFQNFEAELAGLPGQYAPPAGIVFLAKEGTELAGCVALRPLERGVCEMKRLFVRKPYRGRGLGRALACAVLKHAVVSGHDLMRLDTLHSLRAAMRLYESLGFRRIPAYYGNPLPGVVYWEIDLTGATLPGLEGSGLRRSSP